MPKTHVMIPVKKGCCNVDVHDIVYIECKGDCCNIYTADKRFCTYLSLSTLEKILSINNFLRIHRSYMIPLERVLHYEEGQVTIKGAKPGEELFLPVGKSYIFMELYRTLKDEKPRRRR